MFFDLLSAPLVDFFFLRMPEIQEDFFFLSITKLPFILLHSQQHTSTKLCSLSLVVAGTERLWPLQNQKF